MDCKYYSSMEEYYGVAGSVPVMTSGFWECEPDDEDYKEAFLKWQEETCELLEPDFPDSIEIYCDECGEYMEFNATPSRVWTNEEIFELNKKALKKWVEEGSIDEDDYKEGLKDAEEISLKKKEKNV